MTRMHCGGIVCVLLSAAGAWVNAEERLDRGVVALRQADGRIHVGWRLLASDPKHVAFNVYRGLSAKGPFTRLSREPIGDRTEFVDDLTTDAPEHKPLWYSVRAVADGREAPASPAVPVTDTPAGASYIRIRLNGNYTFQKAAVADLDGDGRYDYVIKQPNFNVDPYEKPGYWKKSEDTYKLEAYRSDGKFLWRYDMGWSIEEGIWYSPYVVYDLDGDGKAEVYAKAGEGDPRDPDGRVTTGPEWLVKIDGMTGKVLRKIPWPDRSGYEKYNYYCRNLLGVAYLDGRRPHLIVERGTYTQIKVEAYDPQLNLVWRWNSKDEKERYNGQGMHGMHAADIDGDGRDEVVLGSAVLDDNGRGLWTRGVGHPDACYVGDIDPNHPGLEIFYGIEPRQKRNAVCLVDARTGTLLWGCDESTTHVHSQGMAADILAEYPGQECYAGERDGSRYWLFTAAGKRIGDSAIDGLTPRPAWWGGGKQKAIIVNGKIGPYQGPACNAIEGTVVTIADCLGDWREEIITSVPGELRIYTTTIPAKTRRVCLMQDRLYRLDVTLASMGYFYPPQFGGS
jgi:rhamnogalacturonan endolyase